jgi:hypothetical protein
MMKRGLSVLVVIAACLGATPATAEPVQPAGLPAAKQKFTKQGMPDAVVNDYVQCAYKALYDIMTPLEHQMLDQAARGKGMTAIELRAFERAVADRMDDGDATAHIVAACKAPYERFLAEKAKAEEG